MIVDQLPTLGIVLALTSASGNVLGEVLRKRLVAGYSPGTVTFAYRLPTALFVGLIILLMHDHGGTVALADRGALFGMPFLHPSPLVAFVVYAVVVTLILGSATWAHLKAFQVGELSSTAPLLSFTPVFALLTTWVAFHQFPSNAKLLGILLVVLGAFAIRVNLLSRAPFEPLTALWRDPGSRWMIGVCVLYAVVGPIERSLDDIGGPYLAAMVLAFGTAGMWFAAGLARGEDMRTIFFRRPVELLALAGSDAIVLVTYYGAMAMMPPVIMQTLKRADVLLVVLMGWLIFKERNVARKFFGCAIMVIGVTIIVVKGMPFAQALLLAAAGIAVFVPLSLLALRNERARYGYDAQTA